MKRGMEPFLVLNRTISPKSVVILRLQQNPVLKSEISVHLASKLGCEWRHLDFTKES